MAVDGKPAITTPGQMVLRPVQAAVAAARQRIEKLEQAVIALQNAGGGNFEAVIQSLRISIAQLQTEVALLSGGIFDPQAANTVFAGPSTGTPDEPAFRALVQDDLPDISALSAQSGGLDGDELVAVQLGGVWYQTTVQDIANLASFGSGGGGGGAVDSVNGQTGVVLLDAVDVGAVPGVEYVPGLASGIDGDEILVGLKGSGYYSMTARQIAALAGTFTAASSAPTTPQPGDRWVDLDTGIEYTYFYDGNSYQWVEF